MKPIKLTKFNEYILEYPGSTSNDETKINYCIGIHDLCKGWIDIHIVSGTHKAITCRQCKLRVVIPISIETYGQLREWSDTQEFVWSRMKTDILTEL